MNHNKLVSFRNEQPQTTSEPAPALPARTDKKMNKKLTHAGQQGADQIDMSSFTDYNPRAGNGSNANTIQKLQDQ